jgi:toxoflavin synthase
MTSTESPDQYAAIAAPYLETEQLALRRYAEFPTFFNALGDINGLDVLDLACGGGMYSDFFAARGARRVVGVDISAAMLAQARNRTRAHKNVEYYNYDVASMPTIGLFDIVTAVFLLNYAPDRPSLDAMCERIAAHLKPNGRFAASIPNSHYNPAQPWDDRYQISFKWATDVKDGDEFTFHFHVSQTLDVKIFYWDTATYESALVDAGLAELEVAPWQPSEEGLRAFPDGYWKPWTDNPSAVVISGRMNHPHRSPTTAYASRSSSPGSTTA